MYAVTQDTWQHACNQLTDALEQYHHYRDHKYAADQGLDHQVELQDVATTAIAMAERINQRIQAQLGADHAPASPA